MFVSIKTKLSTLQTAVVAVVCIVISLTAYRLMTSSLRDNQFSKLQVIARDKAERISTYVSTKMAVIERITLGQGISDYAMTYNDPSLAQYLSKFSREFASLAYVTEEGKEELKIINGERSENLQDVSRTSIFSEAMWERNKPHALLSVNGAVANAAYMEFAMCRRCYFDEFEGLVIGKVPLSEIFKDARTSHIGKTGFIVVLDNKGIVLSHPQSDKLLRKVEAGGEEDRNLIAQAVAMKSGYGRATIAGIDGYVAYYPVEKLDWTVMATLPYEEFMSEPNTLRNITVIVCAIMIIAGIVASVYIASSITKGLMKLTSFAGILAKGDLSQRVDIKSKDEVGSLGSAFNYMADRLQHTVEKLNTEIHDRQKAQAELHQANEHLCQAQSDLVQSEKMSVLGELAASVAHEINTPTAAILIMCSGSIERMCELAKLELAISDLPAETRQWFADMLGEIVQKQGASNESLLRAQQIQVTQQLQKMNVPNKRRLAKVIVACGLVDKIQDEKILSHLSYEPVVAFLEHVYALKNAAEISISSAKKIARIVKSLSFYSRDSHDVLIEIDVNETIEDTLIILRNTLKQGIKVETDLAAGIPPVWSGPELTQVWTNIINNACDAIENSLDKDKGLIEISTSYDGQRIVVRIANNGPSIPENIMQKMYDPFFTTKPVGKGTGLGLSICAGILKRYGGTITARNECDKVVFEVTLPTRASNTVELPKEEGFTQNAASFLHR